MTPPGVIGRPRFTRRRSSDQLEIGALFGLITLVFGWPLLTGRSTSVVPTFQTAVFPWAADPRGLKFEWPQSDQAESSFPWSALAHQFWRAGHLPIWDPHSFGGGEPLATDGVSATLYPIHALIDAFLSLQTAHEVFVLVHVLLAGLGCYWLSRRLGTSRLGAAVAGVGWMTGAYLWGWAQLEMVTPFFAWLPLCLAASDRAVRNPSRRHAVSAAALLALGMVAGNIAYTVILAVTVGMYLSGVVVSRGLSRRQRSVREAGTGVLSAAAVLGLGTLLAAGVLVPTLLNLQSISRKPFSYSVLVSNYLVPWNVFSQVLHNPQSPPIDRQLVVDVYLTPAILALGLLGLVVARGVLGWSSRLLVGIPILVTSFKPVSWVFYHFVPGFDAIKPYARVLPVSLLGAYLLAGAGTDTVARWGRKLIQKWNSPGKSSVRSLAAVVLLAAVAIPSIATARSLNPPARSTARYPEFPVTPAIGALQRQQAISQWPQRILPGTSAYDTGPYPNSFSPLVGGTGLVFGFDTWGGYDSAVPAPTAQMVRMVTGESASEVLGPGQPPDLTHPVYLSSRVNWPLACRLGTDLVLMPPAPPPNQHEAWGGLIPARSLRPLYAGEDGRVFSMPGCSSAPYLSDGAVHTESASATVAELQRQGAATLSSTGGADHQRTVVIQGNVGSMTATGAHGRVQSATRRGSAVLVKVRTDKAMWLVLPVSTDPGWSARVDGRTVSLVTADFSHMAVKVGPGTHSVTLEYRPRGWALGWVLTLASMLVCVLLLVSHRAWKFARARRGGLERRPTS